jgi:hypothetical protein
LYIYVGKKVVVCGKSVLNTHEVGDGLKNTHTSGAGEKLV